MKTNVRWLSVHTMAFVAAVAVLSGCATQIDWKTRVGSYTYDQAVVDLGPPDKQAKLTDGTTVAEWLTHRGGSARYYGYGGGGWRHHYHHGATIIVDDSPGYESFLRLVFGPDHKLQSWKKYTR